MHSAAQNTAAATAAAADDAAAFWAYHIYFSARILSQCSQQLVLAAEQEKLQLIVLPP